MVKAYKFKKKKSLAMLQFELLPEHTMGDVINDVLYVNDPPTLYHQSSAMRLTGGIYNHVESASLGWVYPMETGVFIDDNTVVQPDLVYVSKDNQNAKFLRKGIFGAPDLILEILSPSTKKKDKTIKKDLFERIGVREYWIVDPETKDAYGYLLENDKYNEPLKLNSKIEVRILNKTFPF